MESKGPRESIRNPCDPWIIQADQQRIGLGRLDFLVVDIYVDINIPVSFLENDLLVYFHQLYPIKSTGA